MSTDSIEYREFLDSHRFHPSLLPCVEDGLRQL